MIPRQSVCVSDASSNGLITELPIRYAAAKLKIGIWTPGESMIVMNSEHVVPVRGEQERLGP